MGKKGLNPRQKAFVKLYSIHKNATKAAKLAGYSKKTAGSVGEEILRKPEIQKAIDRELEKQIKKADLTAEDVINGLRQIAFCNLSKAYDKDGNLLHPHDMPEDLQMSLQALETDEIFRGRGVLRTKMGETRKIKLADKVRSLEALGRYFKLFTDKIEQSGPDGGPQVVFHTFENGSELPEDK